MLIEHDGKTIDTEREIQTIGSKYPVRYVGTLSNGNHIFEWGDTHKAWDWHSSERAVSNFENVPVTHVRWCNVHPQLGWPTEEEAKQRLNHDFGFKTVRVEWQS